MIRRLSTCGAIVLFGTLLPAASASAADAPACGDVLTKSVRLASDLTCEGTALTVARDGVVVDLGGHAIRALDEGEGTGIALETNAVVKNGVVKGFEYGVVADADLAGGSLDATLSQVTLRGNGFGVMSLIARVTIRSSVLEGND